MPDHDDVGDWSIDIDRDRCIGSGVCMIYAPSTFTHDSEGKATLTDAPGDELESIRVAVEGCPTGALAIAQRTTEG